MASWQVRTVFIPSRKKMLETILGCPAGFVIVTSCCKVVAISPI